MPLAYSTLLLTFVWAMAVSQVRAQTVVSTPLPRKEQSPPPQPSQSTRAPELKGAPGQGLTASFGDEYSLNLKSRLQLRHSMSFWEEPQRPTEQFVGLGTARVWLSGHVYQPELTYLLQLALAPRDYRDGATSPVYDAYLEWRPHRDASLRAGQYLVPFDRLRTLREWGLQMADRPRPVQEFTLDRDIGVTLFSERFLADSSPVAWHLGVFGGRGISQTLSSRPATLLIGRVEVRPLGAVDDDREGDFERRKTPGLAIGAGVARNFGANRLRSTTGPTFTEGTTNDTYAAADLVFKWWGWALGAEYLWKRSSRDVFVTTDESGESVPEFTRSGAGWVLQTSYAFDPPLEVVARLSRLYAQSTLDAAFHSNVAARGSELGAGLNYYLNGHRLKLHAGWQAFTNADLEMRAADHVTHALVDATF